MHSKCKLTFLLVFHVACLSKMRRTKFKSLWCHFNHLSSPQIYIHSKFYIAARCERTKLLFFYTLSETPSAVESVHISFHRCLEPRNACVAAFTDAQAMFDRRHEKLWQSQSGWKKITGIIIIIFLICVHVKGNTVFQRTAALQERGVCTNYWVRNQSQNMSHMRAE